MIAIVDYGCGNLQSLKNAFIKIGAGEIAITSNALAIEQADKIILPGVGSFGNAMGNIGKLGLAGALKDAAVQKPFLGICLGMQLLFGESEESPGINGLCLIRGKVKRFSVARKIPQMGWNKISVAKRTGLFKGIPDRQWFFFANSFFAVPKEREIVSATAGYGEKFCAAVESENIWAVQFHPEKSSQIGLNILKNFVEVKK